MNDEKWIALGKEVNVIKHIILSLRNLECFQRMYKKSLPKYVSYSYNALSELRCELDNLICCYYPNTIHNIPSYPDLTITSVFYCSSSIERVCNIQYPILPPAERQKQPSTSILNMTIEEKAYIDILKNKVYNLQNLVLTESYFDNKAKTKTLLKNFSELFNLAV
jgi:hypothetical protein